MIVERSKAAVCGLSEPKHGLWIPIFRTIIHNRLGNHRCLDGRYMLLLLCTEREVIFVCSRDRFRLPNAAVKHNR